MKSNDTILDSSFIESGVMNTISLGFQGSEIAGNVNYSYSYSFSTTSQVITNNLPAGGLKYWDSKIPSKSKNASYRLMPSIRIVNYSDLGLNWQYTRVESITISKDKYFLGIDIGDVNYGLMDKYRKELGICCDSNGYISKIENFG